MNPIDHHISELLFDHDCVIVPSLGGFLASIEYAKINAAQHTISPPNRKVAFNVYLRQNDGLLANQLVKEEHLAYADALKQIEQYVAGCFHQLNQGGKFVVEQVGVLVYDKEHNLQFEPFRHVNHLIDAFGMGPVQFLPVEELPGGAENKTRKEIGTLRPSEKMSPVTPASRKRMRRAVLGVIAVAGALLWFSINLYLVAPRQNNQGSLNIFEKETLRVPENKLPSHLPPTEAGKVPTVVETVYVSSTVPENTPAKNEIPVQDSARKTTGALGEQTPGTATAFHPGSYYVIAGVFRIDANALAFARSLHDKGFGEARIIQTGKLSYVCLRDFSERKEALTLLDSLNKEQMSAWILHN